ncbi:MAG: alpha/beta hydrolase [Azospirillum sp.]|nr:alpha/beta hydrolase [Azospirillum sp.]
MAVLTMTTARRRKVRLAALLASAILAACSTGPDARREEAAQIAAAAGFTQIRIDGGPFVLTGWLRAAAPAERLIVYIEGDGLAWLNKTRLSGDPTPRDPVALELATKDPGRAVLYLGRPCQYTDNDSARGCTAKYWSSHRFAPEVIDATTAVIDEVKRRTGARTVVLIGYSGGADVAALVAGRRSDVAALATVAGPLDHRAWTSWHQVSPLTGSLNPADETARTAALPQVHFVGADDEVVPAAIVKSYLARAGLDAGSALVVVPGTDHHCCWPEQWPRLRAQVPG